MPTAAETATAPTGGLRREVWVFWAGQTVSNLGTSFTLFALPLLVFKLTGSAMNLALTTVADFLPYLLFGLLIGAWVDRADRKRVMIAVELLRALAIGSIPLMAALGRLSVWWIYGVGFVVATLGIFFSACEFAAIPSLVPSDDLVAANGRIQASYSAATIVGPLLAGALVGIMAVEDVLLVDATSFLVSAASVALVRRSFNAAGGQAPRGGSLLRDVREGLGYVLGHPVLRNISLMMALINFVGASTGAQLVLFAKERFLASDGEVSLLYSAGGAGIVLLSLAAGLLRRRWPFSRVALGALVANGAFTVAFAYAPWYAVAVPLWALVSGSGILFNINTGSLRQAIVPNHLLGRVISIAGVLAWSAIPAGAFIGGLAIEWTGDVALVYAVTGALIVLIALGFSLTALGQAERYLPATEPTEPAD